MGISIQQFEQMKARLAPKGVPPGNAKAVERERDLHDDIFDECRRRRWICFHGSMAERTSRTEGEPDFVILADHGRLFMLECKNRLGKLSPAQQAIAHHAILLGHKIHLVRNLAEFYAVIGD